MDLETAKKILKKGFGETSSGVDTQPFYSQFREAYGFLSGWNARGEADAKIASENFYCCCGQNSEFPCEDPVREEILKLQEKEGKNEK